VTKNERGQPRTQDINALKMKGRQKHKPAQNICHEEKTDERRHHEMTRKKSKPVKTGVFPKRWNGRQSVDKGSGGHGRGQNGQGGEKNYAKRERGSDAALAGGGSQP